MLHFFDYNISNSLEVPNEVTLNFHIAECQNRCKGCFSPELWESTGMSLVEVYENILLTYSGRITCVCFLGEGKNSAAEHEEFRMMCDAIHRMGFSTCLYSGRDCGIEPHMQCFDYIKTGSYMEEYGDLSCPSTNQRLFQKTGYRYENITSLFWNKE